MRGTVRQLRWIECRLRFIPARAGNGAFGLRQKRSVAVHPRACGERCRFEHGHRRVDGSSPRVRGTARSLPRCRQSRRFIPARAGNGDQPAGPHQRATVHPRACGERLVCSFVQRAVVGSSPRVRGTDGNTPRDFAPIRFIPARAGNGHQLFDRRTHIPVHPRACGERQ